MCVCVGGGGRGGHTNPRPLPRRARPSPWLDRRRCERAAHTSSETPGRSRGAAAAAPAPGPREAECTRTPVKVHPTWGLRTDVRWRHWRGSRHGRERHGDLMHGVPGVPQHASTHTHTHHTRCCEGNAPALSAGRRSVCVLAGFTRVCSRQRKRHTYGHTHTENRGRPPTDTSSALLPIKPRRFGGGCYAYGMQWSRG